MLHFGGKRLSIPKESIIPGVPTSENPSQYNVDSGPKADPSSKQSTFRPENEGPDLVA